ncbi:MAG: hypothetical protein AMXMBFR64_36980 [Myxococcales bacterium]
MRQVRRWLSTLPVLALLVVAVAHGTGEKLHAQLLKIGEANWPGYATLRADPVAPDCDPSQFEAGAVVPVVPKTEEDELLDDLLDEPAEGEDEATEEHEGDAGAAPGPAGAATPQPTDEAPAAGEPDAAGSGEAVDPGDDGAAEAVEAVEADEGAGGEPDAAGEDDGADLLDELAGTDGDAGQPSAAAMSAAREACQRRHDEHAAAKERLTPSVVRFRSFEKGVASAVQYAVEHMRHLLTLLLLISAITATALRGHIALRPPKSALDHRVSSLGQLGANALLVLSAWSYWRIQEAAGIAQQDPMLPILWLAGFGALLLVNLVLLVRTPPGATPGGTIGHALLSVPLYASMGLIAGLYFLIAEGHPSGLSIYLTKLTEHASLYIFVGLYVWVGMLLKGTRLARLAFDLVRPWRLPAELLAVLVVVAAAVPTAYSGASGIFVMATAAIIFEELIRAGARKKLAVAATAMSGGFGVVLNPCLLVVIVASLNKEVTTDQIYGAGGKIFLATAAVLLVAAVIASRRSLRLPPVGEATRETGRGLLRLLPYAVIIAVVLGAYKLGLQTGVDEHSAPTVLPVLLLALLVYDRLSARRSAPAEPGFGTTVVDASSETSGHIGALLMLMGLSVCLGGVVERAEVMALLPQSFASPVLAMVLLVVLLVIIGMTMDPYGAVILVSASIGRLAYDSGIDPLHFWLTVLVAFELGYLTPPVALNHLLVRQVVDLDAVPDGPRARSFWLRHEATLLPVTIMGTRLLLVAFVPLFW